MEDTPKHNEPADGAAGSRHPFRERIAKLVSPSSYFDTFILVAIFLNAIALACLDYRVVDDNYQPSAALSVRNNVIEKAEIVFTAIFVVECVLKILAYGFVGGKQAYLRDGWNLLDFAVVIVSILGLIPGVPNFSVLRSFRVLRPLRSVSKLPSLRKVAKAFVKSIGDLGNVMVLLLFILMCFSLFGVTFWRGLFHYRCRLTPFPVRMPADCRDATNACWDQFLVDAVSDPDAHRCLPHPTNDVASWTQSSSQWFEAGPQDCVWPIDETDHRVCSAGSGPGSHYCARPAAFGEMEVSRTCGSNYDAFGNPRLIDSLEPYSFPRMQHGLFGEAFNWGFTHYDDFAHALITTFQMVTLEGWSDILAWVLDGWWSGPAIIAFLVLVFLGGIIAINIVLAVISGSLSRIDRETAEEEESTPAAKATRTEPSNVDSALRRKMREVVGSWMYARFVLGVVVLNTILLSCDHYGISPEFQMVLDAGNFVTTTIFFVDMLLCNVAHGFEEYWGTPSTFFDGSIAVASAFELVLARMAGSGSSGKSVMSVFRSLRLIRLLKMVKQWKSLHSLLSTMARAAADVQSFGLLLCLFVFIYALLGMQIFANRLRFDSVSGARVDITSPAYANADVPRANFDDFFWSMTTVFQVLSGENWNAVLYDCWRATSAAPAYFISLVVLGCFCALNLFLAILLLPFDGSDFTASNRVYPQGEPLHEEKQQLGLLRSKAVVAFRWMKGRLLFFISPWRNERICRICDVVRSRCDGFVANRRFDACLTIVIVVSSITLALDDPLRDPNAPISAGLAVLNYLFTTVFLAEFVVKLLAHGMVRYAQDRWNLIDFSAVVASILELLSVKGGKTLRVLRAFRVLRPLKMVNRFPELKLVLDALLLSLPSVVDVGVVCGLFFLVFSIFGVTFLKGTFYKCLESSLADSELNLVAYPKLVGEMTRTEWSWLDAEQCSADTWAAGKTPTSRELCDCLNGEWVSVIPQNFDNVFRGIATLFEISTTESWVDVMYAAIDQRGINMQPVRDNNRLWALFFVLFLFLTAFFVLELFVGVIVEHFASLRDMGQGILTEAQRQWVATQQFLMRIRPELLLRRPENKLRALCYDVVHHSWFDRIVVAAILANSISLATVSLGDAEEKVHVLGVLNVIFSSVFVAEAALKLLGLGRRGYFRSKWNIFDFAVVCGVAIGFILKLSIRDQVLASSISSLVSLMRMGRLIKLVRLVKPLRTVFHTMLSCIPGLANIGALLALVLFIYAVIGVQLYGTVAYQGGLGEQTNFRSVGSAMLLLLRFSTGEGWPSMIYTLIEEREGCDPNPTYDESTPWCLSEIDYPDCKEVNGCGSGFSVYVYFYSFTLIVSFVILSMFVAVVLQAFEASSEGELLGPEDLEHFVRVWSEFDEEATWFLPVAKLQVFLSRLGPPLGISSQSVREKGDLYPKDPCLLEISVNDKRQVHFVDVAAHLAKRLALQKQDDFRELSDDHPVRRRLLRKSSFDEATSTNLGDVLSSSEMLILRAIVRFRRRRTAEREAEPEPLQPSATPTTKVLNKC